MFLDPFQYSLIYYIVLAMLTLGCSLKYASYPYERIDEQYRQNLIGSLILFIAIALLIGMRPVNKAFTDMKNYENSFLISVLNDDSTLNFDTENIIFDNLLNQFAIHGFDISVFFLCVTIIYFGGILIAVRKRFPKDTFYAYVIYLSAFSTFGYAVNGIKAGAAAAIYLVAISFREKRILMYALLLLSYGFHHSMYIVIIATIAVSIVKNPKYYLLLWILCVAFAALNLNPLYDVMTQLTDEKGLEYLEGDKQDWEGKLGFRLDFIIYSIIPILIGAYCIYRYRIQSQTYLFLYNLYVLTNGVWALNMYIPFNNRLAYLSWIILPIVSVYPFLKVPIQSNQYRLLNAIVWMYMIFSLIMA